MPIARQHLDVGKEVVRQIDRLRALQMRVAGNDDIHVLFAQLNQGALERAKFPGDLQDFLSQPEPQIQRDLIVARAPGMQLRARGHAARQLRFEVHVDVFQLPPPAEFSGLDFSGDAVQPVQNGPQLGAAEHANFLEHGGVGD